MPGEVELSADPGQPRPHDDDPDGQISRIVDPLGKDSSLHPQQQVRLVAGGELLQQCVSGVVAHGSLLNQQAVTLRAETGTNRGQEIEAGEKGQVVARACGHHPFNDPPDSRDGLRPVAVAGGDLGHHHHLSVVRGEGRSHGKQSGVGFETQHVPVEFQRGQGGRHGHHRVKAAMPLP